jgi:hypothetical protein
MKAIEKSQFIFLIMIFTLYSLNVYAQIYSGHLADKKSGQPIPYANIGIIGKNIGTASNAAGWFKMELNSIYDKDTLCISSIGYESKKFLVGDLQNNTETIHQVKIELSPKIYQLAEVIIQPINTEVYTLGNFCESNSAYGNAFYSSKLGTEMGVLIKLPHNKNKAYLTNFRFYVGKFTYNEFPVRLNIYNLKNGLPYENILTEPIFIEITSVGEQIINLKPYKIVTNEDFFISLEYYKIPDITKGELVFCAVHNEEINKGNGYHRLASQGDWNREMFDNVGFSVQVECEE